MTDPDQTAADQPMIRFVHGNPTEEEVAAVVAVLTARAVGEQPEPPPAASAWADYWRRTRRPLQPAPGAWRTSLRS